MKEKSLRVLGLSQPFSELELKEKYREKAFQFHPDQNGKDSEEMMKAVNTAYCFLKDFALGKKLEEFEVPQDTDVTKLWSKCTCCNGAGFFVRSIPSVTSCPMCEDKDSLGWWRRLFMDGIVKGMGYVYEKCPSCDNGKRNGKECNRCGGTGRIKKVCSACNGKGIEINKIRTKRDICIDCGGKGKIEIKPFNPVIKRGAILVSKGI